MHTVNTDDPHDDDSDRSDENSGVFDGLRHSLDARADVPFQQVKQGMPVSARYNITQQ